MLHHMHVLVSSTTRPFAGSTSRSRKIAQALRVHPRGNPEVPLGAKEEKTRRSYLAEPDLEPVPFDPSEWEPLAYGGFDPPPRKARKSAARKGSKTRG